MTRLQECPGLTQAGHRLDLILVPGLGTPDVKQWGLYQDKWADIIASWKVPIRTFSFEHGIRLDNDFTWDRLVEAGADLQADLMKLRDDEKNYTQPVVFVCHSLGGLILKQALHVLNVKAAQYEDIHLHINSIAGIVFMGTPDGALDDEMFKERSLLLVKQYADSKLATAVMSELKEKFVTAQMISKRFRQVELGVDMLSVYEQLPVKRKPSFLPQKRHYVIVDQSFARTDAPKEVCVGISADHTNICQLADSNGMVDHEVIRWLTDVVKSAENNVQHNIQSYVLRNPATPTISIHTSRASSIVGREEKNASNQAQKASSEFSNDMKTIFENFEPVTIELNIPCLMMDTLTRNKKFFGRQSVLQKMEDALVPQTPTLSSSEQGAIRSVVLRGPGGFGKTEIALEFVFKHEGSFDAIFWIRAEDRTKLDLDFRQIAVTLGLQSGSQPQSAVITTSQVKQWLSNPRKVFAADDDAPVGPKASWLLIFDNLDEAAILHDYVDEITGNGAIIVTSRDPSSKNLFFECPQTIDIDKFGPQEGLEFLMTQSQERSEADICEQIVKFHDGHPLALAQIAGYLQHEYLSYSDILDYIQSPSERSLLYENRYGVRDTARGTVSELYTVGLAKLPDHSRALLNLLCFLDPDRIQESMLQNLGKTNHEYNQARKHLLQTSLIRRNEGKKELWMHRVDQQQMKENMTPEAQKSTFRAALKLVRDAWPTVPYRKRHSVSRWSQCKELYPHVEALQEWFEEWSKEHSGPCDPIVLVDLASLSQEAAWWQYERGNLLSAKAPAELALKLLEQVDEAQCTDRQHLQSLIHDCLGCVANGTNQPQASMKYNKKFLELRKAIEESGGSERALLAYAHNQLGCSMMMARKYAEGAELFSQALEIWHSISTYFPGDASMEYANLGLALWLQGQVEEASKVLEKGLAERVKGHGENDMESFRPGRILYALGNVRLSQERYDESEQFHQRALITFQKVCGNRYHRTADVCHKMAQHCFRRACEGEEKSFESAIKLADQALDTWKIHKAVYKPELARTTFLKSKILAMQGRNEDAEALLENARARRRELAPESSDVEGKLVEQDFDDLVVFWSV